jgi:hypothetical protein
LHQRRGGTAGRASRGGGAAGEAALAVAVRDLDADHVNPDLERIDAGGGLDLSF